jgi:hypothetical protein
MVLMMVSNLASMMMMMMMTVVVSALLYQSRLYSQTEYLNGIVMIDVKYKEAVVSGVERRVTGAGAGSQRGGIGEPACGMPKRVIPDDSLNENLGRGERRAGLSALSIWPA